MSESQVPAEPVETVKRLELSFGDDGGIVGAMGAFESIDGQGRLQLKFRGIDVGNQDQYRRKLDDVLGAALAAALADNLAMQDRTTKAEAAAEAAAINEATAIQTAKLMQLRVSAIQEELAALRANVAG